MPRSVDSLTVPKPHANMVTPSSLTRAAASMAVSNSVLPGALSTVCSPSERNNMILVALGRSASAKSCRVALKPSEIEVRPSADISSIPLLIAAASYDHGTRVVASVAKDTTEKRAASSPRKYSFTWVGSGWDRGRDRAVRARDQARTGLGPHGLSIRLSVVTGAGLHLGSIAAWWTSSLAKALSPLAPSMNFFIEPLSSSTRAKSIGVAQGGLGEGGSD
eukprot:scaffold96878_cov45-Phaeocystis_antarctica.AAC.1